MGLQRLLRSVQHLLMALSEVGSAKDGQHCATFQPNDEEIEGDIRYRIFR